MSDAQVANSIELDLKPKTPYEKKFERLVARTHRRNFRLGVTNGVLYTLGVYFISKSTVVPSFLAHLTKSSALIGFVAQLEVIGWYLPQLFVSGLIIHRRQKMPVYRLSFVLRSVMLFTMAGIAFFSRSASVLLIGFILTYGIFNFSAGIGGVVFMELMAKAIPVHRRGRFLSLRTSVAAILTVTLGAWVTTTIVSSFSFPLNFAYLFIIAAVLAATGLLMMAVMREPRTISSPPARTMRNHLAAARAILATDTRFVRFLKARLLLASWTIGVPFIVLYARNRLGFGIGEIGLFIASECLGTIVANFFWERIADRKDPLLVLKWTTLLSFIMPLFIISFGYFPIPASIYALAFAFSGAIDSGTTIGGWGYLLEVSPEEDRATYIGLFNTLLALPCFLTAVAGFVLDATGFEVLYSITAAIAVVSYIYIRRLDSTRTPTVAISNVSTR